MDLPPQTDYLAQQFPAYIELRRDVVLNADVWTRAPRFLSADWGFEGILGVPGLSTAADLNRAVVVGGGVNGDYATLSPEPPLRNLTSAGSSLGVAAGGFGIIPTLADAFPVVFSWPLLPSSISPTDFAVKLNTGEVVTPKGVALNPNYDYNERHVVVMLGEFGNRLKPGTPGAIYPVSVEIVQDDTPLQAIGPNGPQSIVGLSKESRNPFVVGPGLVGARLSRFTSAGDFAPPSLSGNSPNDGASLYKSDAVYRLRLFTWGGFSPDGVSGILPTEFSRFFRLQAMDANGNAVAIVKEGVAYDLGAGLGAVKVVGLAELGKPTDSSTTVTAAYYQEDHDNYIDVILTGDEAAVRRLVAVDIPTSAEAGYSDLYNPGGPGRTPTQAYTYTSPSLAQTIGIDMALDSLGTASYAAQKVASYDAADGLPVVFRLRHPTKFDTVYTASTKTASSLIAQGYVEQGVPFSNEQNHQSLVSVREFYSAASSDHIYTADAAEIERLRKEGSGYVDQGVVFTAIGGADIGAAPIYRFYSAGLGEHIYTPSLTEGFSSSGYAYEGVAWHSIALTPGLNGDVIYDRADDLNFTDALTGAGAFTKRGAGTLTLSGTSALTGATAVEAGTLRVDGALSQSAMTLARGATLTGSGTIGSLTARGVVSPGSTIGTLSAAGAVSFQAGSTFAVDISPTSADRLAASSSVTLNGGTLRVTPEAGTYVVGTAYEVITATGGITGGFSSVDIRNSERLAGLVLNVANTGSALRLSLGTEAALTSGADLVAYYGRSVSSGISGMGANDTVAFFGTGNTLNGPVSGGGALVVGGDDGLAAALALGSGTQSFGSVSTQSNATLTVNARLEAAALVNAGTLGGSGTVVGAVVNTGTLAPGNSPGVMTVEGAMASLGASSKLQIEIDGPTAGNGDGFHDQIAVTGSSGAFIAGGAVIPTLRGFAEASASPYTPALGQKFAIVTATGGVTGNFASLTQPSEGLPSGTRFDVSYASNAVYLTVTPSSYAALGGLSANQAAAAAAADQARPAAGTRSGADADTLFDAFYAMAPTAVPAALDQLSGVAHANSLAAALGSVRLFGDVLGDRVAAVRRGAMSATAAPLTSFALGASSRGASAVAGPSSSSGVNAQASGDAGDGLAAGASFWGKAVGRFSKTDSHGGAAGYEAATGGFVFGADAMTAPGVHLGVGFGYLSADAENSAHLGKTKVGSYAVGAYAGYAADAAFVDGTLSYVFSDYDSRRTIGFGGVERTAAGSGQGHSFSGALTVGHSHKIQRGVVEPTASIRYDRVSRDRFAETGAGDFGLTLGHQTLDGLRSSLGVRAARLFELGETALELETRARWDHDFMDVSATSRASLAGAAFTVSSAKVGRDAAVLGAGVTARLDNALEGFAGYDAELRDGARSHIVTAGFRYRLP